MSNNICGQFQSSAILIFWLNKMMVTIDCKESSLQLVC